jgi:quercetin dioxygenase-like cupin family protein
MTLNQVRRVVTGQTPDGKGRFTHVETVEANRFSANPNQVVDSMRFWPIWSWEQTPTLPFHHSGAAPWNAKTERNPGEALIAISEFAPKFGVEMTAEVVLEPSAEVAGTSNENNISRGGIPDPHTAMHCSDTVDVNWVISGEITILSDAGAEVTLRQGDVLVENGARHAWQNRSDEPCVVGCISFGTIRHE